MKMAKKTEDKVVGTAVEGRAGLRNTKVEKVIEKIITIIFGRRGKTSFKEILDSKQKSVEIKSEELKAPVKKSL